MQGLRRSTVGAAAVGASALVAWLAGSRTLPAAVAPSTVIAVALLGVSLVAGRRLPVQASLLAAVAGALGASVLLGHAFGVDAARAWGSGPSMSPITAAVLLVAGTALAGLRLGGRAPGGFEAWRRPLLVGFGATVVTIVFTLALREREERQLRLLTEAGARRVRAELTAGLDAQARGLSGLAREWEGRFFQTRGAWESDARLVLAQWPGMEALEWIDETGRREWLYPRDAAAPPVDPEFLTSRAVGGPTLLSGPVPLPDDREGIRLLAPLGGPGESQGWLSAVYSAQVMFAEILDNLDLSYAVRIYAGGRRIFCSDPASRDAGDSEEPLQVGLVLEQPGTELRVVVSPSAETGAAGRSPLAPVLLAGGLGMAALLTAALGLRNVAAARARALGREVREHERAEEQVRRLNAELEDRVRRRTAELSRTNRDLGRFASFLSHELRQPLNAQTLWLEVLESHLGPDLDADARERIVQIRSAARRMSELITAQLELAAISTGELRREAVDLERLLARIGADLKSELEATEAALRIDRLPRVYGEPRLLGQLFRNLLENAIKYRRAGVPLEIRVYAREARPDAEGHAAVAILVVEDNGRGFAPEDAERIFEPAQRLDDDGEGHGLGLAICRRIAERHDGVLRAEGRAGCGARFELELPVPPPGRPERAQS